MKIPNALLLSLLLICIAFVAPIIHYNQCQFILKQHELQIDEQRGAPPVKSIFDLELPGVPPMPDHIPEPEPRSPTI